MPILTKLLNDYQPGNQLEAGYKWRILEFLAKHQHNAYNRELLVGHITASAFLINSDASKFLLMHHKKIDRWLQPGGHCDGEIDVLNTAIKEAQEESGVEDIKAVSNQIYDIDIHPIPAYKDVPSHEHFDVRFLLQTVSSDEFVKNNESLELRWIDFDSNIPLNLTPSIFRMIEKYTSRT